VEPDKNRQGHSVDLQVPTAMGPCSATTVIRQKIMTN
jgi:hypothetical protein